MDSRSTAFPFAAGVAVVTGAARAELDGSNVGVWVVHPGGVRTNIAANARRVPMSDAELADMRLGWQKLLRMPPARAAARIAVGIERREPRILVGADAHLIDWLQRLFPVARPGILRRLLGA